MPCMTISKRSWTASDIEPWFEPIGTRDIISTPPEITRSSCPDHTAAAALKLVCIDEPHWRSTVVPQTDTGQPAVSATLRPMVHACSSTCVTHPHCRSSISAGSTPYRSTTALTTRAERSSPRMWESVPFFFPIGLRTASRMSASVATPVYCTHTDASQGREDRADQARAALRALLEARAGGDRPACRRARAAGGPGAHPPGQPRAGVRHPRRGRRRRRPQRQGRQQARVGRLLRRDLSRHGPAAHGDGGHPPALETARDALPCLPRSAPRLAVDPSEGARGGRGAPARGLAARTASHFSRVEFLLRRAGGGRAAVLFNCLFAMGINPRNHSFLLL